MGVLKLCPLWDTLSFLFQTRVFWRVEVGMVDNEARERGMNWSCPQQLTVGGHPASE